MKILRLTGMGLGLLLMLAIAVFFSYGLVEELTGWQGPKPIPVALFIMGGLLGSVATFGMMVEIRDEIKR